METRKLTPEERAGMIDHTLLKQYVTLEEMKVHCETAKKYGFKTVAINNAPLVYCKEQLAGSDVLCDAAVSFPLGKSTIETKVFETKDIMEKGAGGSLI